MKLQLDGDRLRLRLSEAELTQLSQEGALRQRWRCPDGDSADCRLSLRDEAGEGHCEGNLMDMRIMLPREAFLAFAAERPRRDGFAFDCGPLKVLVEVDVRDSHRVRRTTPSTVRQSEPG